jgi:LPS-assembly lipoprotein
MIKNIVRCSFISLTVLVATACGFHMRNSASMPSALAPIFIGGPAAGGALGRTLRYQLNNSNANVTLYSAKAAYHLIILNEDQEQRIISLDRRGLAAEYGIATRVSFELRDKQNRRVLGPEHIDERRTITNNPDNALTTSQDIGLVREDMEQVLAAQIVRRLGAYAAHQLPKDLQNAPATDTPKQNDSAPAANATPTPAPQN